MVGRSYRGICALCGLFLALLPARDARGGAYVNGYIQGAEMTVTHAPGYSGTGGVIQVTVCVDPGSAHAAEMSLAAQTAVDTWRALVPSNENLVSVRSEVPTGVFDFESVVVHELGHCLGLGHINVVFAGIILTRATQSSEGPNSTYDFDGGLDGITGTGDDDRFDDVPSYWFRRVNNDPFSIELLTIDSTTYSRQLSDLPSGDAYGDNGNNAFTEITPIGPVMSVFADGFESGDLSAWMTAVP